MTSESFKTVAKPYNGKMNPCKVCGITPKEGDEMWMQNLGDDINKKWIASPHEQCFRKLQENPDIRKQNKKSFVSKFPISDAPKIFALAESLLDSFKTKRGIQHDTSTSKLTTEQDLQAIESFFKTLSGGFKP